MGKSPRELHVLLEKIFHERGIDFRGYKKATVSRCLGRRMQARGARTYADYSAILDKDPGEYGRLFDELTINVTSFFRNEAAFDALKEVISNAVQKGKGGESERVLIWSAGCSTGEEPYSIAILLKEILGPEIGSLDVKILATDIDSKALAHAREGVFSPSSVEPIQTSRLENCFLKENRGFRVKPSLRKLVTFEQHNLVQDPHYENLDFVVCRNVIIYFNLALQMQMMRNFYRSLNDSGFLLLGEYEIPMGEARKLFYCLDFKAKLYKKAVRPDTAGSKYKI